MKRIAANYVYLSDSQIIKNGFVQFEKDGSVSAFGSLDEAGEIAGTLFLDGVILPFAPDFSAEDLSEELFSAIGKRYDGGDLPKSASGFWLLCGVNLADRTVGANWKVRSLADLVRFS